MTFRRRVLVWAASQSRSQISTIGQYLLRYLIGYGWCRKLSAAMALRPLFAPLRPDLDSFLFAVVGGERNGIPLSTISALTQLGLDPWDEAGRLAGLVKQDAVERLTGEFWLVLRPTFWGQQVYVPFRDGRVVETVDRRGPQPVYSSLAYDPSLSTLRASKARVADLLEQTVKASTK